MLMSQSVADDVISAANLSSEDRVLEIGTGSGMLTKRLASLSKLVKSYEIDEMLFEKARRSLRIYPNVHLVCGNIFREQVAVHELNVLVTSLPFSQSLRFLKWIALRSDIFQRIVAVLQADFVNKICAVPSQDSYKAVSVMAQITFNVERLFKIGRDSFEPKPKILSEVVRLTPKNGAIQPFFNPKRLHLLDLLFSQRRKTLKSAIRKIGQYDLPKELSSNYLNRRIESLAPEEFVSIIEKIRL